MCWKDFPQPPLQRSRRAKAAAPEPVAITTALLEAAKKEGKVVLYSSMDLPVEEKLGKAFEATYPGITIQIERSVSEAGRRRISEIRLMKEDAAGVEAMSEEIKTRYARLFRV